MRTESNSFVKSMDISGLLLARNTILNIFGRAIPLIVGVATIPFIMRGLGIDRFGLLSLSWVVLSYFTIFDFGLGRATTKFVAQALGKNEHKKIPSLVFSAVTAQAVFGITGAVIFWIIAPYLVNNILNIPANLINEAKETFQILAFSIPLVFIASSFRGVLEALQRFDLVNLVIIPSVSLMFILPLVGVLTGLNLPDIIILLVCLRLVVLFVYMMLYLKISEFQRGKNTFNQESFKHLISFGGWVTVSSIVSPILVYIDRFFIGSIVTLNAVGYYSAPSEMVTRLSVIPASLVATLFPAFSFLNHKNKERLGLYYTRGIKYLILCFGPIILLVILFAKNILKIWLGVDIAAHGVLVLQILALGVLINALARVPFSLLQGIGRPDIPAKFHLLELPLYLITVWFLVEKFGINGAALAWTLRVTIDAVLLFFACIFVKIVSVRTMAQNGLLRSLTILPLILMTFSISLIIRVDLVWKAFYALLVISIFLWISWRYSLRSEEKRKLSSLVRLKTLTQRKL